MTKQLSNCCKAGIRLTGSPNHEDGFACEKCGRIIGTPMTNPLIEEKWKESLGKLIICEGHFEGTNEYDTEKLESFIENLLEQERRRLAEEIEGQYPTQYKEWRAFNGFRNNLRDKYIINK